MERNNALWTARLSQASTRGGGQPLSRAELAELVAAEVYRRTGREAPIDAHYVAKLERGVIRWPGRDYRDALSAVLGHEYAELGFRMPTRLPPTTPPDEEPLADELQMLAARAEFSDVGTTAVDRLEQIAELMACAYATTSPEVLLTRIRLHIAEVAALLDRHSTLAQHRRLLVVGGWLALLAATVHVDLGNRYAAATARATATSLSRESEHNELAGWAAEIESWSALIDQDWPLAARLAEDAQALAPANSPAAVHLAAQHARASARLGDGSTVRAALDRVALGVDRQTGGRPRDHHFVFDRRKLDGYTATSLAWLGDPAGESVARQVAARYHHGPPRRLATARIDLGLILARDGRPDEAAQLGLLAADSGRLVPSNHWRVMELDHHLADHRAVPEVAELHQRLTVTHEGHPFEA